MQRLYQLSGFPLCEQPIRDLPANPAFAGMTVLMDYLFEMGTFNERI
jgi:hypothetical protein